MNTPALREVRSKPLPAPSMATEDIRRKRVRPGAGTTAITAGVVLMNLAVGAVVSPGARLAEAALLGIALIAGAAGVEAASRKRRAAVAARPR